MGGGRGPPGLGGGVKSGLYIAPLHLHVLLPLICSSKSHHFVGVLSLSLSKLSQQISHYSTLSHLFPIFFLFPVRLLFLVVVLACS
jgi:hypothetical protein